MSTRAIQFLTQRGVSFEIVKYEHREKGAAYAADNTGFPLAKTIKTLVTDIGRHRYAVALVPGDKRLDLRKLAASLKAKRAAMADSGTAERLTGYFVGGISPFGMKRRFKTVIHQSIMNQDAVMINGGQRGTMLKMKPADIASLLDCKILDIAR